MPQNKKLTDQDIIALAADYAKFGLDPYVIKAIVEAESPGYGFGTDGKLLIQFEPHHFKKYYKINNGRNPNTTGIWDKNKVDVQSQEWKAFNDAWKIDSNAAMMATSIGMMQVMGFNYRRVGFDTINAFYDFAKESEKNQIALGLAYIVADPALVKAVNNHDWNTVARLYNGPDYRKGNYHHKLKKAYENAKASFVIPATAPGVTVLAPRIAIGSIIISWLKRLFGGVK